MQWLLPQAAGVGFTLSEEELKKVLKPVAEAMAAISAVELPDDFPPLFP